MVTSANSSEDLVAAVKGNDLERLKRILQSGVDPNNNRGQDSLLIPLHVAAENGEVENIKCLLQFKAGVDIEDDVGWTALHWAAYNGHADTVELLISHGADVNKQGTDGGWTALHWACCYGHVACVQILTEHGADVALRDRGGKTARDWAVENNNADVVQLLDDFVHNEKRAKGLLSMCDSLAGELRDLKEKLRGFDSLKAELASLEEGVDRLFTSKADTDDRIKAMRSEVNKLSALKATVGQLSLSKAEAYQLSAMKTEVGQLSALRCEMRQLSASVKTKFASLNAEIKQLSALKTDMGQLKAELTKLTSAKAEVNQLSSFKAEVSQLSASKAELDQLRTAVEQLATVKDDVSDLSLLVGELFPKKNQPLPTLSLDAQLQTISQRQDVEDNWWNIGKELGFSRREMRDVSAKYDTNDDSMQLAVYKLLQSWCDDSNLNTDVEKMREIWRVLGKFGMRDED